MMSQVKTVDDYKYMTTDVWYEYLAEMKRLL